METHLRGLKPDCTVSRCLGGPDNSKTLHYDWLQKSGDFSKDFKLFVKKIVQFLIIIAANPITTKIMPLLKSWRVFGWSIF